MTYIYRPVTNSTKQCAIKKTDVCHLLSDDRQVSVQFEQPIEIEEELLLTIALPADVKIQSMWVQGVNMYMGKTAVLVDSSYQQKNNIVHQARLFLGACSEPKMKWQLVIKTIDDKKLEQSWFYNFTTDRNKKG